MAIIGRRDKSVLTWIVFGVDLLRPVAIEGDSVLCCSTGTTVEQRFICGVSIQGLCSDKSKREGAKIHFFSKKTRGKELKCQTTWKQIWRHRSLVLGLGKRRAEEGEERKGRILSNALLICCSVWHPMSCTARGYTHLQSSTCRRKTNRRGVPASKSWRKENNGLKKKQHEKKRVAVGSEIEKQQGDGRDKKLGVNYSFRVDKEAYLSHTFAWWVGLHPGNRLSFSAQCWPYTEIRRRHRSSEDWTFVKEKKKENIFNAGKKRHM